MPAVAMMQFVHQMRLRPTKDHAVGGRLGAMLTEWSRECRPYGDEKASGVA